MAEWYRWQGTTLILRVRVQPRASCDEIIAPADDGPLKVRITAPPLEGKANQHLIKFLAKSFGVARGRVSLLRGSHGREKQLAIDAPARFPDNAPIAPGPTSVTT